jgi:hypothetical protein
MTYTLVGDTIVLISEGTDLAVTTYGFEILQHSKLQCYLKFS